MSFPTSLDSFSTKVDNVDNIMAADINNLQTAIAAIQTKLGIDASAVNTTVDYKLSNFAAGEKVADVGDVKITAKTTAPTGWLLCDGSAVSRTTYAALFTAISTNYGVGNGTTTFNVPNVKGRVIVGLNASDTEFDTIGETYGAKTHTLTTSELAVHSHTGTTDGQNQTHNHSTPDHLHDLYVQTTAGSGADLAAATGATAHSTYGQRAASGGGTSGNASQDHSHTFTTANAGSGSAHNNIQPSIVMNYCIKY